MKTYFENNKYRLNLRWLCLDSCYLIAAAAAKNQQKKKSLVGSVILFANIVKCEYFTVSVLITINLL